MKIYFDLLKLIKMVIQINLTDLPSDILKKFVRNFKMGMVNKEFHSLQKNICIGYNPRALVSYRLQRELKCWMIRQLFFDHTGYILDTSEQGIYEEEDGNMTTFYIDDLFELWYELDIPGIEMLGSLLY